MNRSKETKNSSESKYAYNNPTIQPDEELHHRGYLMHKGQIVPRLTRYVLNKTRYLTRFKEMI